MQGFNPTITLNNGVTMPAVGLGVYRSRPEDTGGAINAALAAGYRMIDTAAAYRNETEVGEAVRASNIARDDIFIQTKLWISDYSYDGAMHGFERSMRKLGFDHVDLYLLHQPAPAEFDRTVGAYKAAEKLLSEGRIRAIGISNFSPAHIERLMAETDIVPAVNQVELHPFFTQKPLIDFHKKHDIVTQAWSPIGGVQRYWREDAKPEEDPLTHPVIAALAEKYSKTPAQIILRWQLDLGISIIPKSTQNARIIENFDIFDFTLTADEIAAIDALDTGKRGGPDPEHSDRKAFPFVIED
ncbi:aldo/keto reductase [uncultured Cohaesibacter sp.]|uniref:aldo/keto reductase n=1 Tax=uncultured Cohaesibacter sp. TaxID=1002546 RepID=UPI0029C69973|nr:aldo/keto reductase [uncultured Cohaesibacter sp.]